MSEATLSIGEVAERAGIAISAIRYYERNGLLPEAVRVSGQRRFGEETVQRLATIDVAKQAGFSLEEVRALLTSIDEGAPAHEQLRALAARKLPEVEALIARAEKMRDWLTTARGCGCDDLESCGLFDSPALLSVSSAGLSAAELTTFYADYVSYWNSRDLESYYSLYAADVVFRDGSAVLHGVDALRNRYEAELRDYPDLTMECVRLFVDVESQSMAAENIERGTGIELRGALFLTLDPEGRISEIAEYLDSGPASATESP